MYVYKTISMYAVRLHVWLPVCFCLLISFELSHAAAYKYIPSVRPLPILLDHALHPDYSCLASLGDCCDSRMQLSWSTFRSSSAYWEFLRSVYRRRLGNVRFSACAHASLVSYCVQYSSLPFQVRVPRLFPSCPLLFYSYIPVIFIPKLLNAILAVWDSSNNK